jgi:hypothetical protein
MQKRSENELEMHKALAEVKQDAGSGEEDDDAEWYKKEVGQDPERGKQLSHSPFCVLGPELQ